MSSMHDPDKMILARKLLLRKQGATVTEIARRTKRSARAVRRWIWMFNANGAVKCLGPGSYRLARGDARWV